MGLAQSSQGRLQRGDEESKEEEREQQQEEAQSVLKKSKDTELLSKHKEEAEEEEEEDDGVHVAAIPKAAPITASQVGESNLRVWDHAGQQLVRMGGGEGGPRRGGSGSIRLSAGEHLGEEEVCTYVYVIRCGESSIGPDVIRGRCASAVLSPHGHRQARALGLSFLSRGLRFDALFCSPLERCKQTALSLCEEINFNQERLEFGEALMEMSNGLWEGLRKFDVYTNNIVDMKMNLNQDFHAIGGESQRQVQFRMVEYVNNVVLPRSIEMNLHDAQRIHYAKHNMQIPSTKMYMPYSNDNHNVLVTRRGKSTTHINAPPPLRIGSLTAGKQTAQMPSTYYVSLFSHEMAIKCLLGGLMALPPSSIEKLCIDPTSITLLKHSTIYGWKIVQLNDTSHLQSV